MTTSNISQIISQIGEDYGLAIAAFIVVIALILLLNRKKVKHGWLNLKTRFRLNGLGHKQLLKTQCPDGMGYHFTIDRLILRNDGISLLVYKKYPGKIFCADNIDDWTQMLGQRSYRFKNPFYDLECQVKAVEACVPNVPVNGYLFFGHQAVFPKGHPDRVIHLDKIPDELKLSKKHKVEASVMSAWDKLKAMPRG